MGHAASAWVHGVSRCCGAGSHRRDDSAGEAGAAERTWAWAGPQSGMEAARVRGASHCGLPPPSFDPVTTGAELGRLRPGRVCLVQPGSPRTFKPLLQPAPSRRLQSHASDVLSRRPLEPHVHIVHMNETGVRGICPRRPITAKRTIVPARFHVVTRRSSIRAQQAAASIGARDVLGVHVRFDMRGKPNPAISLSPAPLHTLTREAPLPAVCASLSLGQGAAGVEAPLSIR